MRAQRQMLLSVAAPCPHRSATGLTPSPSEVLIAADAPGSATKLEQVLEKAETAFADKPGGVSLISLRQTALLDRSCPCMS
jgi:alpha/beta superfamily hydrolase